MAFQLPARSRLVGWWRLARYLAARPTVAGTDPSASDAACERLFASTAMGRAADRLFVAGGRAWAASRIGRVLAPLRLEWSAVDRAGAVRRNGVIVVVAAIVALALQSIEPTPVGPLGWLMPATCAVAGLAAVLWAPAIARIAENRQA
jgi:hypothetical protein